MTYAIDTHAAFKELKQAGFADSQAEALVKIMGKQSEAPAIKTDLAELLSEIKDELSTKLTELKTQIAELRTQMLLSQVAIAGLLFAALKLL